MGRLYPAAATEFDEIAICHARKTRRTRSAHEGPSRALRGHFESFVSFVWERGYDRIFLWPECAHPMSARPIQFRNVVRYCKDVQANVPLYEALGFRAVRAMEGFALLQNEEGVKLVLHEGEPEGRLATALGFTMLANDVDASRAFVEKAGWRLLRAPDAADEGFFFIYGDLDGNPINLVGERRHSG